MRGEQDERSRIVRGSIETLLRLIACGLLAWAFAVGSYSFPASLSAAIALITLLCLLTTYELMIRDIGPEYVFGGMMIIIIAVMGGYGAWRALQPPEPTGPLLPAGEASPGTMCRERTGRDDLAMSFGSNRVVGRGAGPYAPFAVDGCPVLKLERKGGGLMVIATGYDWSNDVAFMVRNNLYEATTPVQLRVLRPDRSTFVLLDRFDQEVVYVRYLNRGAVRIRGRFLCGEAPQAVIRDQAIFTGGIRIGGAYLGLKRAPGNICATTDGDAAGLQIGTPAQD